MHDLSAFASRRQTFLKSMQGGVAIIPANGEVTRSADTHFRFRQDNNFLYLSGFPEPDAVMLLMPNHPEHQFVLFVRPRNKEMEIWNGRRFGPEGAKEIFGADAAYSIDEIDAVLPTYLENQDVLYHGYGRNAHFDMRVNGWLNSVRRLVRKGINAPETVIDPASIAFEMRLMKDEADLRHMRRAGQISAQAHRHGMKVTRQGMNEAELQIEMEHYCRQQGAQDLAYGSIVAGGDNANILHYTENNQPMNDGDLVLVDLGCEVSAYAADITRTWPVNGRFTTPQKEVYDLVLAAQHAAMKTLRTGNTIRMMHEVSSKTLAQGLIDLGILKGDAETHMRVSIGDDTETEFPEGEPVLRDFYMHGTGHWLGMDVHDCGKYRFGQAWRTLEAGMVTTVEPGLYFASDNPKAPKHFRGIGVRIEDDVLVTEGEPEVLTAGLPNTTEEVEAACNA